MNVQDPDQITTNCSMFHVCIATHHFHYFYLKEQEVSNKLPTFHILFCSNLGFCYNCFGSANNQKLIKTISTWTLYFTFHLLYRQVQQLPSKFQNCLPKKIIKSIENKYFHNKTFVLFRCCSVSCFCFHWNNGFHINWTVVIDPLHWFKAILNYLSSVGTVSLCYNDDCIKMVRCQDSVLTIRL